MKLLLDILADHYHIRQEKPEGLLYSFPASTLIEEDNLYEFLQTFGRESGVEKPEVMGIRLASWLAFLCSGVQYAVTFYDQLPDWSLDNLSIQLVEHKEHNEDESRSIWLSFQIDRLSILSREQDSYLWRKKVLTSFYSETIRPLFETLNNVTSISLNHCWKQLPSRLYNNVDHWLENYPEKKKKEIKVTFHILVKEIPASCFGIEKNPFDIRFKMIQNPAHPEKQLRLKPACCLAYLAEKGHGYCTACPLNKPSV